jgi:lysophospholipase L1-like esterase
MAVRVVAGIALMLLFGLGPFLFFFGLLRSPYIWGPAIRAFEAQYVPPGSIVFIGSSSFRFWTTLASDMAPLPAINRGFGGATVRACNHWAPRILARAPAPRAVVLYAGGNDLAWWYSVDRVFAEMERFVALTAQLAPNAPVYILSVQLAPSRPRNWQQVRDLNARVDALAARSGGRVRTIDVVSVILDAAGRPRRELFVFDGVHMNPAGYALWTQVIRPRLMQDLQTS